MKTKGGPWAAEEDAVVLTMDARAAAKKLGRTYGAVNTRRHTLRHPEPKPTNLGARWTAKELSILRARYPTAQKTSELMSGDTDP